MIRKTAMPTGNEQEAAWMLGGVFATIAASLGWMKVRVNTLDRIAIAKAEGVEAKAECAKLEQRILSCQLDIGEKYASIDHLKSVETNVKDEMKAVEGRLMVAINGMNRGKR